MMCGYVTMQRQNFQPQQKFPTESDTRPFGQHTCSRGLKMITVPLTSEYIIGLTHCADNIVK